MEAVPSIHHTTCTVQYWHTCNPTDLSLCLRFGLELNIRRRRVLKKVTVCTDETYVANVHYIPVRTWLDSSWQLVCIQHSALPFDKLSAYFAIGGQNACDGFWPLYHPSYSFTLGPAEMLSRTKSMVNKSGKPQTQYGYVYWISPPLFISFCNFVRLASVLRETRRVNRYSNWAHWHFIKNGEKD